MKKNNQYMGSVKVGPKGQVVIPKEVREMFGIQPGDTLMLLADPQKGIAIERMSFFTSIADAIFKGRGKELYPEHTQEETLTFAKAVQEFNTEEPNNV